MAKKLVNYVEFINDMCSEMGTQEVIMENEMFSRKEREKLENDTLEKEYYYGDYQENNW